MPFQIISTKLTVPSLRARAVVRPHLIQKLNQGLECGFVLISAPAGYGKSTLLGSWLNRLEIPATWLTLDDRDNDLPRFLAYLEAALRRINPNIDAGYEAILVENPQAGGETLLTSLINQIEGVGHTFCLVIDDYHAIQNQAIHQMISFLLEHRPASLRLVISTRADPPLPLARLRAGSCMLELRLADLRFTTQEATDFLNHTMGLRLSPEDAASLTRRTEGWVAGLQMAALSIQNSDDVAGLIATLSGSHHYIFDYLLEEILARQPPEIHRFLLSTSILEQLCGPLCDALLSEAGEATPAHPSSIILEQLDHSNLFIIPQDHEQQWYRYHSLFSELLRGYLQKNEPNRVPQLYTRASAWYEEQGLVPEAIHYAFHASDWERVVRLFSANIFALLEQHELNRVTRQFEYLGSENSPARPWLLLGRAWLSAYTGQVTSAEGILKTAETQFDHVRSEQELQILAGHIATVKAYINWMSDRRELAAEAANAALEWLPPNDTVTRCQAATMFGLAQRELFTSARAFEMALDYARKSPVSHVTIFAQGCYAWMLAMQGRLRDASAACHETIYQAHSNPASRALPTLSHVYTTLSFVLCEWNDLESALHFSEQAVNLARRWEQADALHFALDQLGAVLFSLGDTAGAFEMLHQAWGVAQRTSRWFESITIAREVEWCLAQDNLTAGIARLHQAQVDIESSTALPLDPEKSQLMLFTIVDIFLAQKKFKKALDLAENLALTQNERNIGYFYIRTLLQQSLAYHGLGQVERALDTLKNALTLAAPEGYVRSFVNYGQRLSPLLRQAGGDGTSPEYISTILAAIENSARGQSVQLVISDELVEQLSEREMDVLTLLSQGCSDKKIAEKLVIARETVHKHLKNIYGKLDVHSRTEAVARARELDLL